MADKRISRSRKRELDQPDEFITFSEKLLNYAVLHKKKIFSISGSLIVLILVVAGARYYSAKTEEKALLLLEKGVIKYEATRETKDPEKVYLEVKEDFKNILDKYPEKKAGKIARVILADICYAAGEFDMSIELYERSLKKFDESPFYNQLLFSSLAYAHEQKKEFEKAIEYMEMINSGPNPDIGEDALYHMARLYAKTGHADKEIEYYKKIQEEFPNSIYTNMVKEKLASRF